MVKTKDETIEGEVIESLPNTMFRVKLPDGRLLLLSIYQENERMYRIRVLPGDKVKIETTPYDESKGRIVYRTK